MKFLTPNDTFLVAIQETRFATATSVAVINEEETSQLSTLDLIKEAVQSSLDILRKQRIETRSKYPSLFRAL